MALVIPSAGLAAVGAVRDTGRLPSSTLLSCVPFFAFLFQMKEHFQRPKHPHAQGPKSSSQWYKKQTGWLWPWKAETVNPGAKPWIYLSSGSRDWRMSSENPAWGERTLTPYTYNHTRGGELDAQWLPLLHSKGNGLALDSPFPGFKKGSQEGPRVLG